MSFFSLRLTTIDDTKSLAERVAKRLQFPAVIALDGELGSGKTTFVRLLAKALGSNDAVSSPTFTLEHRYQLPNERTLQHWDLYRCKELPLELMEPPAVTEMRVIEWANKAMDIREAQLHFEFELAPQHGDSARIVHMDAAARELLAY